MTMLQLLIIMNYRFLACKLCIYYIFRHWTRPNPTHGWTKSDNKCIGLDV